MMGVERIHACPNYCILYHGVFKDITNCPNCGVSRYKINEDYSEATNTRKKRKKDRKKNDASPNKYIMNIYHMIKLMVTTSYPNSTK
jgi:predicted  nucleic acid-binding Zn-ribbon protein